MNSTGWVAAIIVLILIVIGAWWYAQQPAAVDVNVTTNENATTTVETPATSTVSTPATSTPAAPKTVTVTYSDTGFSPKTVTIAKGDTVKFVSNTTRPMQVAADEHPTHTQYDGTTRTAHCASGATAAVFDQCTNGTTYSFTFNKTGTFDYHNHSAAQFGGTVTVQ